MKFKKSYIALLLAIVFFASCDDGYEYYDGIYMGKALGDNINTPITTQIVDDKLPINIDITIASTSVASEDIIIEVTDDASLVDDYNKKYGTLYQPLPKSCYVLSKYTTKIEKGNYGDIDPIVVSIISIEDMVDGVKYMIPVSIKNVSGGHKVIDASRTIHIALNQIIIGPALRLVGSQYATTNFTKPAEGVDLPYDVSKLPKVTMEARVIMEQQDGSKLNTIFGLEENFCLRRTSEAGKKGQLELTGGGINNVMTPEAFPLNVWTHVAVVYDGDASGKAKVTIYLDGEQAASMDVVRTAAGRPMVSLHAQYMQEWDHGQGGGAKFIDDAPFWIGKSERARYLHGSISEAKIWAKALTPAEIKANMCITDPTSDMLIAYWRFNNGGENGQTFKDLTGHGFDMTLSSGTSTWTDGVKCPENY